MSTLQPAAQSRLDQLFHLARQLDDAAIQRTNLQAVVWFHPSNRAELGGDCCLGATPSAFTHGHEGQRVDIEDWHHSEQDGNGRYERWRVILSTTEGTVRNDNTATAFTTYTDLAEQVLAHVPSDDTRPPQQFGRLLTHLAEMPSVAAWGHHPDVPGSWVRRDGVKWSISQRAGGRGRPLPEDMRALPAAVRGGFRPVAWCAHIPRPFRSAAQLVRAMAEPPAAVAPLPDPPKVKGYYLEVGKLIMGGTKTTAEILAVYRSRTNPLLTNGMDTHRAAEPTVTDKTTGKKSKRTPTHQIEAAEKWFRDKRKAWEKRHPGRDIRDVLK